MTRQQGLEGSWRSKWFQRLEGIVLLCLALHGVTILLAGGGPGDWLVVVLVLALSGWAIVQPAPGSAQVAVRAAGVLIAAWTLSAVSGGPGSLFILWFFALALAYPLLLPLRFATSLPIVATLLYVSLGAVSGALLPWGVILSQALLIALMSGIGLYFRRRQEKQIAPSITDDERAQQLPSGRLTALDRLARGVAHDFNNLITVIAGQIALAQRDLGRRGPAYDHLQNANAAVEQAIALSRRLQISSSHSAWEVKAIALDPFIESQISGWRESAPARVTIQFQPAGDLPDLRADPSALRLLLKETIAHRAAAFGGNEGELIISTGRKEPGGNDAGFGRYTGYMLGDNKYVTLAIGDNGDALSDEHLATLFEPYQVGGNTAPGLGMAMVLGIVRSHQGGIAATSVAGQGNTLTFLFPTYQGRHELVRAPAVADAAGHQSALRLILLVSADLSLRESLEHALGDSTLRVMAAGDSAKALALHAEFASSVELVVINKGPGIESEVGLVEELRQRNALLPVIVIGQRSASQLEGQEATYLSPTTTLPELAMAVQSALSGRRSPDSAT